MLLTFNLLQLWTMKYLRGLCFLTTRQHPFELVTASPQLLLKWLAAFIRRWVQPGGEPFGWHINFFLTGLLFFLQIKDNKCLSTKQCLRKLMEYLLLSFFFPDLDLLLFLCVLFLLKTASFLCTYCFLKNTSFMKII